MKTTHHRFTTLNTSLELLVAVRPLVEGVGKHDKSLMDQMRRAAQSIHLNLSESCGLRDGHRRERFRTALGSAYETRGALEVAAVFGYVDAVRSREALRILESLIAQLYRLAMPR